MQDQASGLRQLFSAHVAQTVAWFGAADPAASGLLARAAGSLAARAERVLLIDEHAAPGASRRHLVPAQTPVNDVQMLLRGEISVESAPWRCAPHLDLLTAERLGQLRNHRLQKVFDHLNERYDYLLFDCAGHPESPLVLHACHWIVAAMPGKRGMMQAYAGIKRLAQAGRRRHINVVVTGEEGEAARQLFHHLSKVADEHLGLRLRYLGASPAADGQALATLLGGALPHPAALAETALAMSA